MAIRAGGRHCAHCDSTVIDLSRATRSQAEAIVRERGGDVCARVRANARGETVFAPEPMKRGVGPVLLAGLLAACSAESADETPAETVPTEVEHATVGLAMPASGSFGGSLATGAMMPIGPAQPALVTPVPAPALDDHEESVEPTDEQRALTRRKHQRHVATPPTHHLMGRMPFRP